MPPTTVTLLSKPGCHLCDDAREIVHAVIAEFADAELVEKSILDDPQLHARYWDEIPVVLIDDDVHTIYRVDVDRLRAALAERSR
ncbi:glutaredoxin family protein [Microcella sp.]|uniref:glutaredoxin family protein n=1 Tax=Microcella sp. TaxID=1913979 RepID=UPI002564623F|nr:glutaredoxin family protein [Microcella sp.]MBX9471917.1 glutaredoxin family protein [Microcella sp.]